MTCRALRVGWRVLACMRQYAFIHVIWTLQMYGEEADALRRGARVRQLLEDARKDDVIWIRQVADRMYYGEPFCPHCTADGKCIRCSFLLKEGVSPGFFFQEPPVIESTPEEWEQDIELYREIGVLA